MTHTARLIRALVFATGLCVPLRADTVVMKTGQTLEGTVLSQDDRSIELQVEYGTMRVPWSRILRIEEDTPEKVAAREAKEAADRDLADKMREEGKVLYKGQWVTEEEKKKEEDKLAAAKKKKDEERAKAKKKADEEARQKEQEEKRRQQERQQYSRGTDDLNPRAQRFEDRHWREGDENNRAGNNNYGNNTGSGDRNRRMKESTNRIQNSGLYNDVLRTGRNIYNGLR